MLSHLHILICSTKARSQPDYILDTTILANHQSQLAARFGINALSEDFCIKLICRIIWFVSVHSFSNNFGTLTAVDKIVDLSFAHAGSLGCAHCSLLLLAPVVYIERVFSVAGIYGQYLSE
jgi:hypothetical protein